MEEQVSQLIGERGRLSEELQQVVAAKKEVEDQLHDYTEETSQQVRLQIANNTRRGSPVYAFQVAVYLSRVSLLFTLFRQF